MESNKKLKVKVTIIVVLILVLAITIFGVLSTISKKEETYIDPDDIKLQAGFVPKKIEECTNYDSEIYSVGNVEEAINYLKMSYPSEYKELLKLELVDDEEFYYTVYESYKRDSDKTYDKTHLFFKKDIIDIDNQKINLNKVNNKNKIRTIFNIYNYVENYKYNSIEIEKSSIKENKDKYVYTIYFYDIMIGDWGMFGTATYYKQNIVINKKDGTYKYEDGEVIGKFDAPGVIQPWY